MDPIVILGTGLAGYTTARELRKQGYAGPLTLVSADDAAFYSKPMISNALAQGRSAEALIQQRPEAMAAQLQAQILSETQVLAVDPAARTLTWADGQPLRYAQLVLALGAEPLRLPLGGDAADQVLRVNNRQDYAVFQAALQRPGPVVVLGAGLIGCEFANDLRATGREVHVVDPAPWPLGRLVPEEIGGTLQQALAEQGVFWHLGRTAASVDRADQGLRVTLSDGAAIDAAVVLSAVGLQPRTALAQQAGLAVGRGISVDSLLQTSAAGVYALGDCAELQGVVRPFVQPLLLAAKALAKTLCGTPTPLLLPPLPVVVKTPALPLVVTPPPPGLAGHWHIEGQGRDRVAWFVDPEGQRRGVLATGSQASRRDLVGQLSA